MGCCWHTREWTQDMPDCPPSAEPIVISTAPKVVKVIVEETDFFDFDKFELTSDAKEKLGLMVKLVARPGEIENIKVMGYTDRIGTDDYNQSLSLKRAQAVHDYLVDKDQIPDNKVEVIAMGKKDPRVSCAGVHGSSAIISCLAPNRRVEVYLTFSQRN